MGTLKLFMNSTHCACPRILRLKQPRRSPAPTPCQRGGLLGRHMGKLACRRTAERVSSALEDNCPGLEALHDARHHRHEDPSIT
eukprot:778507-Prorocentrum_lima.AAC.1